MEITTDPAVPGNSQEKPNGIPSSSSSHPHSSPWEGSPPSPDWDQDVKVPCRNVRLFNGIPAGCGQCISCRARKAKTWGVRLQLEMAAHSETLFITLTYDEQNLPAEGSLHKRHLSMWLKRLRDRIFRATARKVRFFGCGEYGTNTGRAHYHVLLFGVGMWASRYVSESWPHGFIHVKPADGGAGPYVAGYVVKKLTSNQRGNREPEFILMSRRPGIGAKVADALADQGLVCMLPYDDYGDIVSKIKKGPYTLGISGYIQNRARIALTGTANVPPHKKAAKAAAVYAVQMAAAENGQRPDWSDPQKALQIEQKFLRTRQNEAL